jgi:hypothetical protein
MDYPNKLKALLETTLADLKAEPAADDPMIANAIKQKELEYRNKGKKITETAERPYVCVHAKKGKYSCNASSSYNAAKKAAEHWKLKSTAGIDCYLADITHTATESTVVESRPTRILELLGSKGIGSLPQVEKIINIHGQRDGMAALIRTTDGNAYEVVIRQAGSTKHPSLQKYTTANNPVLDGAFGKAACALAIAAALWGGAELSSAKHTPLGKALYQAAQNGDQVAAKHLNQLDVYVDSGNTATLEKLNAKYLNKE